MKVFKYLADWYQAKRQRYIERMKQQGKCPICKGYGYETIANAYVGHSIECHSCKGTGLYSEWENSN
ncbi:hypothetical protein [Metabacillus malikii]|uniref:DnaJ-class molecular chaperone n=1 Tax=Metabacillus malikii TaxID=1504265 RepID=A0ABT9ZCB8_9BACI|nr:hypothetical protein [Metabacillus malikii]MDQ0229904.1 DnaJ-class molecular chaperone [Metabacillus malikii]